jgi:four helix bundle protein
VRQGSGCNKCGGLAGKYWQKLKRFELVCELPAQNEARERAPALHMGVRHFSQLICWQLSRDLQREVFRITSKAAFNGNFDLRDQLRDAAGSARRNIAEGFGRRPHKDQANFFATALSSMNEVEDELGEAVDNGYVTS